MSTTKLYQAIGEYVVSFNALEDSISGEICRELALEGQKLTDVFNGAMSFSKKVDFLTAIIVEDQELEKRVKDRKLKLLGKLRGMNDQRNLIVHSTYNIRDQSIEMRKSKLRGSKGLIIDSSKYDIGEMKKASERNSLWVIEWMFVHCD